MEKGKWVIEKVGKKQELCREGIVTTMIQQHPIARCSNGPKQKRRGRVAAVWPALGSKQVQRQGKSRRKRQVSGSWPRRVCQHAGITLWNIWCQTSILMVVGLFFYPSSANVAFLGTWVRVMCSTPWDGYLLRDKPTQKTASQPLSCGLSLSLIVLACKSSGKRFHHLLPGLAWICPSVPSASFETMVQKNNLL